jgi:murein DD-endopeptidase MepM/ murein hydrolase activator NlpD
MRGLENVYKAKVLATALLSITMVFTLDHSSADALRSGSWSWPLSGARTIERGYVAPHVFYGPGHRGIDLVAQQGQEVFAPADGVVHFVGAVVDRNLISLELDGMLATFEPVDSSLYEGQRVSRGQVIGVVGFSTHCTCLHMGARKGADYLSPLAMLASIAPAVLLPWD